MNAGAYYQTRIDTSAGYILANNTLPTNTATFSQTVSGSFKLAAGGTIRVWVYQGSGGNENIGATGTDVYNTLTITKVS
jgi:hypothetical protein